MRIIITLLVLFAMVMALVWQYKVQLHTLESHQIQQKDQSVSKDLQPQVQCRDKANGRLRQLGLAGNTGATAKGHFSASLNQCYELIGTNDNQLDTVWKRYTLYDADGKVFATYGWRSEPGKKGDVPPFTCQVTLPSGASQDCKSEADFRYQVDAYMK